MDKLIRGKMRLVRALCAAGAGVALVAAASCGSSNNGGTGGHGAGTGGHDGGGGGNAGAGLDGSIADSNSDSSSDLPIGTSGNATFNTDTDGFAIDTFMNPGPYTDGNPQNLGGAVGLVSPPAIAFDGGLGMPAAGSLIITSTFTDFNQTVNVRRVYPPAQTISLAGKILTAEVRLDPGSTFTGTVQLFALSSPNATPGYYFAEGNPIRLLDNGWHTLTFNLAAPEFAATGFDAADVVQLGVQLASGSRATAADAGAGATTDAGASDDGGAPDDGGATSAYGAPQPISVHFDTLSAN